MKIYQKHWLTPGEPLYDDAVEAMSCAINKGYSCTEIKRVFNMDKALKVYRVLISERVLQPLQRQRRKNLQIPSKLFGGLEEVGLSFLQWSNSFRTTLEPGPSAKALFAPMSEGDRASELVHRAFYRDFPGCYTALYGKIHDEELYVSPIGVPERFIYRQYPEGPLYVATVEGEFDGEVPKATHATAEDAHRRLKSILSSKNAIKKLYLLPERTLRFR